MGITVAAARRSGHAMDAVPNAVHVAGSLH